MDYKLSDIQKIIKTDSDQTQDGHVPGFQEKVTHFIGSEGKRKYQDLFLDGLHIGFGYVNPDKTTLIKEGSEKDLIELHFLLRGKACSKIDCFKEALQFEAGQYNLIYLPGYEKALHQIEQKVEVEEFEIHFTRDLFEQLTTGFLFPDAFKDCFCRKSAALLFHRNKLISSKANQLIKEIMACPFTGTVKKLIVEAKALELLALTLQQAVNKESRIKVVKRQDVEKLHTARDILEERYSAPPTLAELATLTALNEFKLKKGFRELFGETVYGYVLKKRMETAWRLLREKEMNICEIAESAGYKNATHFTAAFKKMFGILPKDVKQF